MAKHTIELTSEEVSALTLLMYHRKRPEFGWMEPALLSAEAKLDPLHTAIHNAQFDAMDAAFRGGTPGVTTVAPAQPQRRSAEGFLCYAWGESDKPIAQLVRTRDEVLAFFVAEWFGEKPEAMCAENREQWDEAVAQFDGDWDGLDSTEWHFEIGGVRVTKVFFYAPPDGVEGTPK